MMVSLCVCVWGGGELIGNDGDPVCVCGGGGVDRE